MNILFFRFCCALLVSFSTTSLAATYVWDGGDSTSDILSAPHNWVGDIAPPSDITETELVFSGQARPRPHADMFGFKARSLTLANTFLTFTLSGSVIRLGEGGIVNNANAWLIIDCDIDFGTLQSVQVNAASGPLTFFKPIYMPSGELTVTGAQPTYFSDIVFGPGPIRKIGSGVMRWSPSAPVESHVIVEEGAVSMEEAFRTHTFGSTATIAVHGTAQFTIYENTVFDGAVLSRGSNAFFAIALPKRLTLQNAARLEIEGVMDFYNSPRLVVDSGSKIASTGNIIFSGGELMVSGGGRVESGGSVALTTVGRTIVDGIGSSISGGLCFVGFDYDLTFRNGSSGTFDELRIVPHSFPSYTVAAKVESGASISASGLALSATHSAGPGTITLNGGMLSLRDAAAATIGTSESGSAGSGSLIIGSGGVFHSGTGLTTVNATGVVTIAGGQFFSHGDLFLRGGRLTRDAGGVFSLDPARTFSLESGGRAYLEGDYAAPAMSTIVVDGAGSELATTADLIIADGSVLQVRSAGLANCSQLQVGNGSDGAGGAVEIAGAGSRLVANSLEIGSGSGVSGTLTVAAGATLLTAANTHIHASGTLHVQPGGTVAGASSFAGAGLLHLAGNYTPGELFGGQQTASVTFAQDLVLHPTSVVAMEIGGREAGSRHDQILFSGTGVPQIAWNGTLQVLLINGFTPAAGDVFDLFDFNRRRATGSFQQLSLPMLPAGLFWRTDELYTAGRIRVSRAAESFAQWQQAFGVGSAGSDDDRDGILNGIEFLLASDPTSASSPGGAVLTLIHSVNAENRTAGITFRMPADPSPDARYRIRASADLVTWSTIASKGGNYPWSGAAAITIGPAEDGWISVTVLETINSSTGRRFHRLEGELQ